MANQPEFALLFLDVNHEFAIEDTVTVDLELIKGMTNILLRGAGVLLATLKEPGRIWLHSLTESKTAQRLAGYMHKNQAASYLNFQSF